MVGAFSLPFCKLRDRAVNRQKEKVISIPYFKLGDPAANSRKEKVFSIPFDGLKGGI